MQFWQKRVACQSPVVQPLLKIRRHHQVRGLRAFHWFLSRRRHIHVVTTTVVLGTISTLWESLVASDVSTFASSAPFAGFSMALSWRSASRSSHPGASTCLSVPYLCGRVGFSAPRSVWVVIWRIEIVCCVALPRGLRRAVPDDVLLSLWEASHRFTSVVSRSKQVRSYHEVERGSDDHLVLQQG